MVGPSASLWDLTPDNSSLGLVKNFAFSTNSTYVSLTQDMNRLVYSVMTSVGAEASMDVFEFTHRNAGYSLGITPRDIAGLGETFPLAAEIVPIAVEGQSYSDFAIFTGEFDDTTLAYIEDNQAESDETFAVFDEDLSYGLVEATDVFFTADRDVTNLFPPGGWFAIQDLDNLDKTHVAEVISCIDTGAPTFLHQVTFIQPCGPFSINSRIMPVSLVDVGATNEVTPTFGVKVSGFLSDSSTPMSLVFPKVRFQGGFKFSADKSWNSLPLKFKPMSLVPGDALYRDFYDGSCARVFAPSGGYLRDVQPITVNAPIRPLITTPRYVRLRNGARIRLRPSIPLKVRSLS